MWATVPAEVWGSTTRLAPANLGYPPLPPLPRGERSGAAEDAAHLLRQLGSGAEPVHLYAHSYGGNVAMELARHLGPRVHSMFLFEPVLFAALARDTSADPAALAEARWFHDHPWFLKDASLGGTDAWLEVFIDYWNRPGSWVRLPEPMKAALRACGWKMFQEVRSCAYDATDFPALPNVPCTLVTAERSPIAARAMVRALARLNPHARVATLPGVGHMAPLTNPAVVNEALLAHVQGSR